LLGRCSSLFGTAFGEPTSPRKFDEFGNLTCSDELIRLDNYGKQLRAEPNALGVIIVYAARSGTRRGEVVARLFAIRDALIRRNGIDAKQIVLLDGGFRHNFVVELWMIPFEGSDSAKYLITSEDSLGSVTLRGPTLTTWRYNCDRRSRGLRRQHPTTRWTGAAVARFASHLVRRRLH
jgi:hypothetical protein